MKKGQATAINSADKKNQAWVHLIPAGTFCGLDGRGPWKLEDGQALIENTLAYQKGVEVPLDYEHQSIMADENGRPAPAAGWFKKFESRENGVWGLVEFTASAQKMVEAKEYRYISPVFTYDRAGRLLRLASAALVAQPNLELTALNKQKGDSMEEFLKELAIMFGLAETAAPEEIMAAARALVEAGESPQSEGAEDEISEGEKPEDLPQAVAEAEAAIDEVIEAAKEEGKEEAETESEKERAAANKAMHAMGRRLAHLEAQAAANKAESLVRAAMATGKISPAQRGWALNYAKSDPAGFASFAKSAPRIISPGRASFGLAGPKPGELSDGELAVCKQLGLTKEAFLKAKKGGGHAS